MRKISLLLIIGIYALLTSGIISTPSNSVAVFNTTENNFNIEDYSVEELARIFFNDNDVNITKISESEFYINDSNYYLSYVNGDISYTLKGFNESNKVEFTNILLQNSIDTINKEYDTRGIYNITRLQALEQVNVIAHRLGLEVEEPYVFIEGYEDYCFILWNDSYTTTAYKTINEDYRKYRNFSKSNIGKTMLAVVTKDGIVELELSKIYGAIDGAIDKK